MKFRIAMFVILVAACTGFYLVFDSSTSQATSSTSSRSAESFSGDNSFRNF